MQTRKVRWLPSLLLLVGLMTGGCRTYQEKSAHLGDLWRQGEVQKAAEGYSKLSDKHDSGKDQIIWKLEEATSLRAAGKPKESLTSFEEAEAEINRYELQGDIKVASESVAFLSNQANLPYRGKEYDKIMLNTYKALDFLELGDFEAMRVELVRAYRRQQTALQENQRRIEKAIEEERKGENSSVVKRTENSPEFNSRMRGLYSNLDEIKAYEGYVNPFTTYLDGLFHLYHFTDLSDVSRAKENIARVIDLVGENEYLLADLALVEQVDNGQIRSPDQLPPTTVVIFETGRAPVRDQARLDIPILFANVSYVGAAFPQLRMNYDYFRALKVSGGGVQKQTALVASMDSIVAKEFQDELPLITTKTLASAAAKATGGYFVNQAANQSGDDALRILARLGTAALQAAVNIADTRTWTTLPKEFQYCTLPTPDDRKLVLETPGGQLRGEITLNEGDYHLVYVRSISTSAPLLITQMNLR